MKQYFKKRLLVAGLALLTIPAGVWAQKEKDKKEDKKNFQQIIITRKGDKAERTVIEIKGDKVTVNGKDASKDGDITVNLTDLNELRGFSYYNRDRNSHFNFDLNHDSENKNVSLFSEDANRAMLGVVTDEDEKGAKITSITKESGAEKAGLKVGDVITKIGDDEVEDADDVSKAVRRHKPGDKVSVTLLRDGKEQRIMAELGKWKGVRINNFNTTIVPSVPSAPYRSFTYNTGYGPKLGLSVQDTDDGKGVKVLQVTEESSAAKAGILKDDVIMRISDEEVESTDDVVKLMRQARNEPAVNLQVMRGGKLQNVEVRIPRKLKTADL